MTSSIKYVSFEGKTEKLTNNKLIKSSLIKLASSHVQREEKMKRYKKNVDGVVTRCFLPILRRIVFATRC